MSQGTAADGAGALSGDPPGRISLGGDTGIRAAADIMLQLREALARHRRVVVESAGVTGADITTVQTLLAARRQALASGGEVALSAPLGEALANVLRAGGFLAPGLVDAGFWSLAAPDDGRSGGPGGGPVASGPAA